MVFREPTPI